MYNNQGYQNYRRLVKKLLKKLRKSDQIFALSSILWVLTKAYESLEDNFPKCDFWIADYCDFEELNFTFYNNSRDNTVTLKTTSKAVTIEICEGGMMPTTVDISAYKELSIALIFALKHTLIIKPNDND